MDPKITGQFISKLRKEHGMTQKQMAEKLNVSDKAVSRWETGKGYPDIESLSALSDEFGVSINELLLGKQNDELPDNSCQERQLAEAYINTVNNNKNFSQVIKCIVIFSVCFWLVIAIVIFGFAMIDYIVETIGSDQCIISHDYRSMTLFGREYVPIAAEKLSYYSAPGRYISCCDDSCIIAEAQVEGVGIATKFFFGDSIYSVENCDSLDVVRLQTEYDDAADYYCAADKISTYTSMLNDEKAYDRYVAEISPRDNSYESFDVVLDEKILREILSLSPDNKAPGVDCNHNNSNGDLVVGVCAKQADSPFRMNLGLLLRKDGGYYWFDLADIPAGRDNSDYSDIDAYYLSASVYPELDRLFAMLR